MKFSMEALYVINNDDNGETLEVGEDRDGLYLIEIRSYTDDRSLGSSVSFTREQLPFVIAALQKLEGEKK